jgi:hypothetical protein
MPKPNYMVRFLLPLLLLGFALGCKVPHYSLDTLPEKQLHFGERDPFAGSVRSFILLDNGQVFKRTFQQEKEQLVELEPFTPEEGRAAFRKLDGLRLEEYDYHRPEGMSPFLRVLTAEIDHEVIWGARGFTVREEVGAFYEELMTMVEGRQAKPEKEEKPKDDPYW